MQDILIHSLTRCFILDGMADSKEYSKFVLKGTGIKQATEI